MSFLRTTAVLAPPAGVAAATLSPRRALAGQSPVQVASLSIGSVRDPDTSKTVKTGRVTWGRSAGTFCGIRVEPVCFQRR